MHIVNPVINEIITSFACISCQYNTTRKSDYVKHCSTRKHIINTQLLTAYTSQKIICPTCNKQYKDRSGLWRHKKTCIDKHSCELGLVAHMDPTVAVPKKSSHHSYPNEIQKKTVIALQHTDAIPHHSPAHQLPHQNDLLMEFIKQNQELKTILMEERQEFRNLFNEQTAKIEELSNKQSIVINNNTSTHFNLHIFLNEKCKDAITIMDFVNSLQVNTSDVEYTGRYGYVQGITKIFIDGLKQLDIYKRPIHCTDLKREILYIKEENSWEKDSNEKTRFKKALGTVVRKNVQQIEKWQHENPRSNILDSKEYFLHLNIMRQSLGGGDFEKTDRNNEKIIRNIAKEVLIDKKKV